MSLHGTNHRCDIQTPACISKGPSPRPESLAFVPCESKNVHTYVSCNEKYLKKVFYRINNGDVIVVGMKCPCDVKIQSCSNKEAQVLWDQVCTSGITLYINGVYCVHEFGIHVLCS